MTKRILLLEQDRGLLDAALEGLRGEWPQIRGADSPEAAWEMQRSGPCDILLCDTGIGCDLDLAQECHEKIPGAKLVLLIHRPLAEILETVMEREYLGHFIAVGKDFPVRETLSVLSKLAAGGNGVFGLSGYLLAEAESLVWNISDSIEKEGCIRESQAFLEKVGIPAAMTNRIGTIIDEVIMNMLWNAPVDGNGKHLFKQLPRMKRVKLSQAESGRMTLGYDGDMVAISARDPFGSMNLSTMWRYLKKCLQTRDQMSADGGSTGLGLFFAYSFADRFIINVDPGRATEFVFLFDPRKRSASGKKSPKSFHYFEVSR